jgi:hypothetical protein
MLSQASAAYDTLLGQEDDIHAPLFIGSIRNPDHWSRMFYRRELPTAGLLLLFVILELASLFFAAAVGQKVYLTMSIVIAVTFCLLPAFFISSHLHRIITRRVFAYNFYNGKLAVLRANGTLTEYLLDKHTSHESGPEHFLRFIPCARHQIKITITNPTWFEPLDVFVLEDDKFIFLRYLSYAISEELESTRPPAPAPVAAESSAATTAAAATTDPARYEAPRPPRQREWMEDSGSSGEDWDKNPLVDNDDDEDWLNQP